MADDLLAGVDQEEKKHDILRWCFGIGAMGGSVAVLLYAMNMGVLVIAILGVPPALLFFLLCDQNAPYALFWAMLINYIYYGLLPLPYALGGRFYSRKVGWVLQCIVVLILAFFNLAFTLFLR